jgi:Zn-dependent peptidase ImmA (M78 family)
MATRTALLDAGRRAGEILRDFDARRRIDDGYTRIDPVKIAENAGVAVMYQRLDKLLGAFVNQERPGIIVNVARAPGLVHMTCAHELGHYFLDHEPTADVIVDYGRTAASVEQEADQFAYSLLAPQWLLIKIMKRKGWTRDSFTNPTIVYQLSLRLGTSYTSTVWTLVRLGLLASEYAQQMADLQPKKIKQSLAGQHAAPDGTADVWFLDETDRDAILEPHKNDAFVFELKSNAGAGYLWSMDEIQSEGFIVEPVLNDVRHQPVMQHFGKDPLVGADASLRFIISRPQSKQINYDGRTPFRMVEHRPWMPPASDDYRCQFAAEYESLEVGVDKAERLRRLNEAKADA